MSLCVCGGALLQCSFGTAPTSLMVLPTNRVTAPQPLANIMDHQPFANIIPFGMCSSPTNPRVALATAAALGVLTPMPCVPSLPTPWESGSPTMLIGGAPALTDSSKCMCSWGGMISISFPGQLTLQIP